MESVRKGVTAKGQGGSLKERAKQASGAGPRARTPNASARSPFSGRVRTSGTADDRPRPAWRGSSATGAAADVRERQTSKLMVVRSRTPTRQSTAPGEAGDPAEGQPALAGEEADMEERSKDVERRRAREAGLSSKETQLERRETALRKASETLEREKAAIAVRLNATFQLFFFSFFSKSLVWRGDRRRKRRWSGSARCSPGSRARWRSCRSRYRPRGRRHAAPRRSWATCAPPLRRWCGDISTAPAACHLALILCPVVAGGELPGSER